MKQRPPGDAGQHGLQRMLAMLGSERGGQLIPNPAVRGFMAVWKYKVWD